MRTTSGSPQPLPLALAAAILADFLVAWTPRYWPTTVGMFGISLVTLVWALSAHRIALPRETLFVAAIAAWGPLQLIFHTSVLPSLTMRNSLVWMICGVVFIIASQIMTGQRSRHAFLRLMLWVVTGIAVMAMLQAYSHPIKVFGIFSADDSVVGTMYYKNHFAALMELVAPIALWEVGNGKVVAGGLCYAAMFAATVTSLSRAGTIGVLAELLVFIALMVFGRKLRMKAALAVTGALAVLVVGAAMVAGTGQLWTRMREPNPYQLRQKLARSTFEMVKERPWLGFGMGAWRSVYPRFATLDTGAVQNEAHNDLVQWASEAGIPFFVVMTGLVLCLGKRILQSVWALGLIAVFCHCYVDYALRAPPLQFLWFALAGAVAQFNVRRTAT